MNWIKSNLKMHLSLMEWKRLFLFKVLPAQSWTLTQLAPLDARNSRLANIFHFAFCLLRSLQIQSTNYIWNHFLYPCHSHLEQTCFLLGEWWCNIAKHFFAPDCYLKAAGGVTKLLLHHHRILSSHLNNFANILTTVSSIGSLWPYRLLVV